MVTKSMSGVRDVINSSGWVTPSSLTYVPGLRKRARLSAPIGPHAINNISIDEANELLEEVESDDDDKDLDGIAFEELQQYNILISQLSFQKFITENFSCKHCHGRIRDRSVRVDKIGFASNVLWSCENKDCPSSASILAPTCKIEASGKFRRRNVTTPAALGDYAIKRQVLLACQQPEGGAILASTTGGWCAI